jgi:hypothetical protein
MAYYDTLISAWNGGTQPPAGVTGTALTAQMTTAQKLAAINGWTVTGASKPAVLSPSQILNAIVFADLAALTQLQVSQLTLLLAGSSIDASVGTPIRAGIQALFAGKTTTLAQLGTLVAPFDSPTISWTSSHGYPNLTQIDATNAGLT